MEKPQHVQPEETMSAKAESLSGGKFKVNVSISDSQRDHLAVIRDVIDAFATLHDGIKQQMEGEQ